MQGTFISLEGSEGVGKTTQMNFICEFFQAKGVAITRTREPGGTPLAERIRSLLLADDGVSETMASDTELLLMFAARSQHIQQVIRPGLEKGFVITDRFTDATYAYQGGGRGISHQRIQVLENWVQQGLQPDLTIILDAPVDIGRQRAGKRSAPDRIEQQKTDFFERVRQTYLDRASQQPDRYCVIDATPDIETIQQNIQPVLQGLLDA
jgi:dTMP kinase